MRVRQYNKRYFTLDFDSRVFFYAHAENSKKASTVIAFSELLDVRLPESQTAMTDNASECSRQSKVSFLKRMGSFGTGKKDEELDQNCLSVLIKPDKVMDLVCSDAEEVTEWLEALRVAIDMGGGAVEPNAADGGDSPTEVDGRGKGAGRGGGYPGAGKDQSSPDQGRGYVGNGTAPPLALAAASADGNTSPTSSDGAGAASAPPPAKKNFLDFGAIEEEKHDDAGDGGAQEATVVSETGLCTLQASDFGFAADEDGSSAASSSAPSSPRAAVPTLGGGAEADGAASKDGTRGASSSAKAPSPDAAGSGDSSPASAEPKGEAAGGYQDRHKGLTLQERLANLEFSDDEDDDDDDPLGLKSRGS